MCLGRGLMKILLVTFSALFLIAGVAIVSIAIWTIVDKVFVSLVIGTDLFSVASYFLLIGGIFVIATAILGVISITKERKKLIMIFLIALCVIFLILFIGAIMTVVFRGELEEKMVTAMQNTLKTQYGNDNSNDQQVTAAWDKIQHDLRCCSVKDKDWYVYRDTAFFLNQEYVSDSNKKYVPQSCCVFDLRMQDYPNLELCQSGGMGPPRNPTTGLTNEFLYYGGCYKAARSFLLEHSVVLVAIGFVFSLTMIGGIVLTVFFIRRVTLDAYEERRHRYTEEDIKDEKENERL